MILRIWNGYTTKQNAAAYERLVTTEVIPAIANKDIVGYHRIQLLRKELEGETQFTTIMWFDNIDAVKAFVGEDYETVYVPDNARKILSRFDQKSSHHEMIGEYSYDSLG